jgi:predicted GNAT family acetyltransferase
MARHPLDSPVWAALTTRQASLALGDARALRFDPAYSPFGAAADGSEASLAALADLIPADGDLWLLQADEISTPPAAKVLRQAAGCQMTAAALTPAAPVAFTITPLTEDDAPQMLALATRTEPGPFLALTHRLSEFIGVKVDGRLVAMAGERMKPEGFAEVSGVCTHPDHRGCGYAGGLMRAVAQRILARGETPFLHAYASNTGAIALYESLGFTRRSTVTATVLARAQGSS